MDPITCPHCLYSFTPGSGQKPPPWCRRCGGALASRSAGVPVPVEELVALSATEPSSTRAGGRWGNRPASAPVRTATPRPSDTPAPGGGRWATQRQRDRRPPEASGGWSPDMEQRVEELVARELDLQPPAFECYLFVVACAVLPVVTLGGAMWCAVGFGGATSCAKIAHSQSLPRPAKFLACLGITAGAWGLFVVLLLAVAGLAAKQ